MIDDELDKAEALLAQLESEPDFDERVKIGTSIHATLERIVSSVRDEGSDEQKRRAHSAIETTHNLVFRMARDGRS